MASDESRTVVSSIQEDEYDDIDVGIDYDYDHDDHQTHPHNFSRFSMSTSSIYTNDDDDDDNDDMEMYMSRLSIESFDSGIDEEFSGEELLELSPDSDEEPCYYSLPAIPPHRRKYSKQLKGEVKDYGSSFSGESMVVITRPKGGRRSLCMDMEEVKACRDLGFELEHECMLKMPSRHLGDVGEIGLFPTRINNSSAADKPDK